VTASGTGRSTEPLIKSGVSPFEGVMSQWFGWAGIATYEDSPEEDDSGSDRFESYTEGPIRFFHWRARVDAWLIAWRLRRTHPDR
jgi:hypothetical protein